jgi:arylsulfatase A-like enzyme
MKGDYMVTMRKGLLLVLIVLLILLVAAGAALAGKPTRVLIITFDQMQPGYAQQYGMTNVLDLQKKGVHFNKAYVGQMASETVVSHPTIVSGLFPKHTGFSDEVTRLQRDILKTDGSVLYPAGSIVTTGDLGYNEYTQLVEQLGYPKLGDYMHQAFPGSVVGSFGQKGYQVETTAASSSDYYARMDSSRNVSIPS